MRHIFNPIHPGEILNEEFLKPMGITGAQLARSINVEKRRIYDIINCHRSISAETDLLFAIFFKTSIGYWLSIQQKYDLDIAKSELSPERLGKLREIELQSLSHQD
jgi:addiction module HigA family antidote